MDRDAKSCACVDPGDGEAIYRATKELDLDLKMILCTHKHNDHTGGNLFLKEKFPAVQVVGPRYEPIPGITQPVGEGDIVEFDSLQLNVLHTPCHTSGHIAYFVTDKEKAESQPLLFCGDTLFVGGCGRFFEGTAHEMLSNMDRFATLPSHTQVCCAHEYTEGNFKFLASVDPETCGKKYEDIVAKRKEGLPTVPSTIEQELKYNLFMNCRDERLRGILSVHSAEEAMQKLRTAKNNFS